MGLAILSETNIVKNNTKLLALETLLQQSIITFREVILEIEQQHLDSETHQLQYLSLKTKCENKICSGAEELKNVIAAKDQIIQSVASVLTKLSETKNFNFLSDAFKILFGEVSPLSSPSEENPNPSTSCTKTTPASNIKEDQDISITEDVSYKEESVCEIDGTPTGRTSPIIHTRKIKSASTKASELKDKKKCPDDWPTSESKAIKLIYPTPSRNKSGSSRLRQSRLNLVKLKHTNVVDLTCSPETAQKNEPFIQALIKKESIENDDTILPSPTSGPTNFSILKTASKPSPNKFKKPPLSLKNRTENVIKLEEDVTKRKEKIIKHDGNITKQEEIDAKHDENQDICKDKTNAEIEESINILHQFGNRLRNGFKEENKTPVKMQADALDEGCVTDSSISLLHHVEQLEQEHMKKQCSPTKRPLAENINVMNTPPKHDAESSMSILRPEPNVRSAAVDHVKKKIPELVEPIYKEPAARKKADKRNLQGWSCDECKNFFGELYKNDPVMLAKKINECSKHRGRHNPARPKTPPNFWNPRWHVPTDTEELNRMNNG